MGSKDRAWLIGAFVVILAGLLLGGGVVSTHGRDLAAIFGGETETVEVVIRESFRDVTVRADTEDVTFLPSEDGKCRVVFRERKDERHTASVRDGALVIEGNEDAKWYEGFTLFSFGRQTIEVRLPEKEYGALLVRGGTGDVTVPKGFRFGSVDVDLSTGDAVCGASASGGVRIGTSTGDIRIEGVSAAAVDLSVSTGSVEVRSASCEGEFRLHVSTGRALLKDVACGSLVSDGNTGRLTLENVKAAGSMTVERSTGDVEFVRCDGAEIEVKTSTGDVTGTLLTPKAFRTETSTGKVRVPETAAGGTCRITTGTGDIEISVP